MKTTLLISIGLCLLINTIEAQVQQVETYSAGNAVKVFVNNDVVVLDGSSVTAQIQSTKHIHVLDWLYKANYMNGLFIAKHVHGFVNVNWNKHEFSSPCTIEKPDASYHKSDEITTDETSIAEFPKVKTYPNPVIDILNVSVEEGMQFNVKVYNMWSQEVISGVNFKSLHQLNLSHLDLGTYLLKVTLPNGSSQTIKVIKN